MNVIDVINLRMCLYCICTIKVDDCISCVSSFIQLGINVCSLNKVLVMLLVCSVEKRSIDRSVFESLKTQLLFWDFLRQRWRRCTEDVIIRCLDVTLQSLYKTPLLSCITEHRLSTPKKRSLEEEGSIKMNKILILCLGILLINIPFSSQVGNMIFSSLALEDMIFKNIFPSFLFIFDHFINLFLINFDIFGKYLRMQNVDCTRKVSPVLFIPYKCRSLGLLPEWIISSSL